MKRQKKHKSFRHILKTASFFLAAFFLVVKPTDTRALGEGAVVQSGFFDKQKIYTDERYVLKDFLEFSVFDLAEMEVIDQSGTKKYAPTEPPTQEPGLSAETEIRKILPEAPALFFKALKVAISSNQVPVTVYATEEPTFANPLKLYIKIKKIHLYPVEIDKKGGYNLPMEIRIYGQIKDKRSGKVLTRYYDSSRTSFVLKRNQATQAFEMAADDLMRGLAQFLKTRY